MAPFADALCRCPLQMHFADGLSLVVIGGGLLERPLVFSEVSSLVCRPQSYSTPNAGHLAQAATDSGGTEEVCVVMLEPNSELAVGASTANSWLTCASETRTGGKRRLSGSAVAGQALDSNLPLGPCPSDRRYDFEAGVGTQGYRCRAGPRLHRNADGLDPHHGQGMGVLPDDRADAIRT